MGSPSGSAVQCALVAIRCALAVLPHGLERPAVRRAKALLMGACVLLSLAVPASGSDLPGEGPRRSTVDPKLPDVVLRIKRVDIPVVSLDSRTLGLASGTWVGVRLLVAVNRNGQVMAADVDELEVYERTEEVWIARDDSVDPVAAVKLHHAALLATLGAEFKPPEGPSGRLGPREMVRGTIDVRWRVPRSGKLPFGPASIIEEQTGDLALLSLSPSEEAARPIEPPGGTRDDLTQPNTGVEASSGAHASMTESSTSGDTPYPELVHRVQPDMPEDSIRMHVGGRVILEGRVGTDGIVRAIRVLKEPVGFPAFSEAAKRCFAQWGYRPAMRDGSPVEVPMTVVFDFEDGYDNDRIPHGEPPPQSIRPNPSGWGLEGGAQAPKLISRVTPKIPRDARDQHVAARVEFEVVIHSDGRVRRIKVLSVAPANLAFVEEAAKAVRKWRYEPATLDGRPIPVKWPVTIDFDPDAP